MKMEHAVSDDLKNETTRNEQGEARLPVSSGSEYENISDVNLLKMLLAEKHAELERSHSLWAERFDIIQTHYQDKLSEKTDECNNLRELLTKKNKIIDGFRAWVEEMVNGRVDGIRGAHGADAADKHARGYQRRLARVLAGKEGLKP